MKKYYYGIDVLRGLGIFIVITLHTAFYFYHELYSVDLNNPSLIITLIGFLLMFAGLFAMISGFVYTLQFMQNKNSPKRLKGMLVSGVALLLIAYLYFIFTGPGLIHFDTQSMDESIFVALINQGQLVGVSADRWLYVDSLVMLALNIILLVLVFKLLKDYIKTSQKHGYLLIFATVFLGFSYLRLPLYSIYITAREENRWLLTFLLNWFVAKNNPILPFFAFALYGCWFAMLLRIYPENRIKHYTFPIATLFIVMGVMGYILTPETMLEREIDATWYFIMVTQIGLFLYLIHGFIAFFDFRSQKIPKYSIFISRFGVAGLTPFFFESIVSALIFALITLILPLKLLIPGALIYGLSLSILWGILLKYWQKIDYRYGIEWCHSTLVSKVTDSSKSQKLKGENNVSRTQ